ncbi:MAG: HEAT repeat domain-containing protein, partial [Opitutaceae bacterium]
MRPSQISLPLPALALALALLSAPGRAAESNRDREESRLLAVLASTAPLAEREAAVVRLHRVGSERAVPELGKLLSDSELSHAARHALESMPFASAGRALTEALATTVGPARLGLISSLASRREITAVPALAPLLREAADVAAAEAAAHALGMMPEVAALAALEAAWPETAGSVRAAVVDALLAQAWRLLGAGESREAGRMFRSLHSVERDPRTRLAADEGMIRAAGAVGLALVRAGLTGTVEPERAAALRVIEDLPQPGLSALLRELLPQLSPALQRSVLEGWLRRADPPPREAVRPLLASAEVETRLAAIRGLGQVGGAHDVGALLALAAGTDPERRTARLALTTLRAGGVTDALRQRAREGEGAERLEAVRALGERGDRTAAKDLLVLARSTDDALRLVALRSLASVIDQAEVAELVGLVAAAPDASRRGEAGRALALTLGRLQPAGGSPALLAVTRGMKGAAPEVRAAFVAASGGVAAPEVRDILRGALSDEAPEVRSAALNAFGTTNDPALFPDVRELAVRGGDEVAREAGTRAAARLLAREGSGVSFEDRIGFFRVVAATGPNLAQRRIVLNALASGRSREELALAVAWLDDEDSAGDAASAVVRLAPRVPHARPALAALRRVQAKVPTNLTKHEVASALEGVDARA